MSRKNIHTFDETSISTLKDMLYSSDKDANAVAMEMLRNANLKDETTLSFITNLTTESVVDTYNKNADVMKELTEMFTGFIKKGILTLPEPVYDKSKEVRTDISMLETAMIEFKFGIRKKLAKEWLKKKTTDERKLEIENEINVINRYVANIMNVEYEDRH